MQLQAQVQVQVQRQRTVKSRRDDVVITSSPCSPKGKEKEVKSIDGGPPNLTTAAPGMFGFGWPGLCDLSLGVLLRCARNRSMSAEWTLNSQTRCSAIEGRVVGRGRNAEQTK